MIRKETNNSTKSKARIFDLQCENRRIIRLRTNDLSTNEKFEFANDSKSRIFESNNRQYSFRLKQFKVPYFCISQQFPDIYDSVCKYILPKKERKVSDSNYSSLNRKKSHFQFLLVHLAKTKPEAVKRQRAICMLISDPRRSRPPPQTSGFMLLSQMPHNRVQQAVRSYHQKSTCRIFQYVTGFRFLSPIAPWNINNNAAASSIFVVLLRPRLTPITHCQQELRKQAQAPILIYFHY